MIRIDKENFDEVRYAVSLVDGGIIAAGFFDSEEEADEAIYLIKAALMVNNVKFAMGGRRIDSDKGA